MANPYLPPNYDINIIKTSKGLMEAYKKFLDGIKDEGGVSGVIGISLKVPYEVARVQQDYINQLEARVAILEEKVSQLNDNSI